MEPSVLEDILDGRKEPMNLPFALLKNITRNFSKDREIGRGGFGTVYKGLLTNGIVAVKKIMGQHTFDENLFRREVNNMLKVNHLNVVRFLGYCASTEQTALQLDGSPEYIYAEIRERLLCFEYIGNGSLHGYITDELRGLEWNTRYQIIRGICEGLHYLHTEKHILHMDLKPDNILLDNDMIPKITDFGLSRPDEKSQTMSADRYASLGYCAPEYLLGGRMSVKFDVYSLGVIIIELVTGHKDFPDYNNVLRRWRHRWNKSLKEIPLVYQQQVFKCIKIGLLCQDDDPHKRPSIEDIIHDMNTMEGNNGHIINTNESTLDQASAYAENDMLGIEPLNLYFPFELNKQMACSLQLSNDTNVYIAFNIQTMSPLPFCAQPNKGIVPPQSKCSVDLTLQLKQKAPQHAGEFIVQSTKVNSGLAAEDINTDMFNKETDNVVDEVHLEVAFDSQLPSELLGVHPLDLLFPFEHNKLIPCSLLLTNNTDEAVVFNLMESDDDFCFLSLPLDGVVPPRSTYTLVVVTDEMQYLPEERKVDLVLQHCISYDVFDNNTVDQFSFKQHFEEANLLGNTVHKMTLKAILAPWEKRTCEEPVQPSVEITSMNVRTDPWRQDVNPTEPWIITGYLGGKVSLWNYRKQKLMGAAVTSSLVYSIKFIERKLWILVGTSDGFIQVYDCKSMQNVNSFRAHAKSVFSISVHPIQPFVLSSSEEHIRLWDWENGWLGWKCIQTFEGASGFINTVVFNPDDTQEFATSSSDGTVQIWSLDSPKCKYTLLGHSDRVTGLDFFKCYGQRYLITGSDDRTAKIWDIQKKMCVRTLDVFADLITSVMSHPSLPLLITVTSCGVIYFWSSTDFRLTRILHIGHGERYTPVCVVASRRIAVGHGKWISMIEIDDEEPVAHKG